jgi:uncharacterized membrane protein (UPF0182 family)
VAAIRRPRLARTRLLVPLLAALVVLVALLGGGTRLYTDLLFFRSVGFSEVFTTVLYTRILLFVLFGAVMAVAVGTNIVLAYRFRPPIRPLSAEQHSLERYRVAIEPFLLWILLGVCTLFGGVAGLSASTRWQTWLSWRNGESFGKKDPQFGRDISYYAFTYPFERFLLGFLLTAVVLSLLVTLVTHYLFGGIRIQIQPPGERVTPAAKAHISVLLGLLALVKAWAYYLDRYGLVFSDRGFTTGASYTDVHAVLPAKLILLFISVLCAVLFIYNIFQRGWTLPVLSAGILVLSAFVVGGIYPAIVQQFQVRPNEASREAPYIDRNISATRQAYGIQDVKLTRYNAAQRAEAGQVGSDTGTIPNARLLDPNVVSPSFQQLQQIRGYYDFVKTLDIDRYTVTGDDGKPATQDYVVAVREVDKDRLTESQRNWINLHLTYTHGNGFVAAPANEVDGLGRPSFVERDLPPSGAIDIKQSRIYFGETSPSYSIVGTRQQEIDGPGATPDSQATTSYDGRGGVSIGSTFRRLLFAVRFQEKNILLSGDITGHSRILYIRSPRERVHSVAPWLTLDGDAYPAVVDKRVVWIIDGYTTTNGYPYAERRSLNAATSDSVSAESVNRAEQEAGKINYIRNSVKATVDAYDGTVTLYAWEKDGPDPVLRTWMKAFPGTVRPMSEIPAALESHFRYPEDLFKVQRDVLGPYHVTEPRQFYSQEDYWAVSDSPDNSREPQPPFYVYSQLPGARQPTFNLTSPMISRRSSKLASYVAVSSDPTSYGRFTVLQLPQGTTINAPVQARGAIESNGAVSQQLNLWTKGAGSDVRRGNLLTLPVAGGLLYIQPYYVIAASEQGYPTLQGVAVAFGDSIGFGGSLGKALDEAFGEGASASATEGGVTTGVGAGGTGGTGGTGGAGTPAGPSATVSNPAMAQAISDADRAFNDGEAALKKSPPDYAAYGQAQGRLRDALAELDKLTGQRPTTPPSPAPSPSPTGSKPPP